MKEIQINKLPSTVNNLERKKLSDKKKKKRKRKAI